MPNDSQFEKLKALRTAHETQQAAAEQRATPAQIKDEHEKLAAGEPVGGKTPEETPTEIEPPDAPPAEPGDHDDDDDDDGEEPAKETVAVRAHERAKPAPAPPGTEAIELDGKTVYVAPELAAAFRDAETAKVESAKDAEANALVDRIATKVKESLPPQPLAKTQAELDAEKALAMAESAAEAHPMPDAKLQISDPDVFASQLQAHIAEKSERSALKALAEQRKKDQDAAAAARATNEARAEEVGREQLGVQFYAKYKVLADAAHKPLVDVLLAKKWDDIRERLRTNPPKTAVEGEALKKQCFDEVAAAATRQIVAIRQGGGATAPAPAPPKVAASRAPTVKATPTAPPAKEREKYPAGSMSAMLASHKAVKEGKKGAAA